MSLTFTKLFSSITESTVWCEPDRIRICWIAMLAMADRKGRVWASIPGLANRARIPVEDAKMAIDTFLSPDYYSRTRGMEGRRIEAIDGGWQLINYDKYRAVQDEQAILESKRKYINARREAERKVDNVDIPVDDVDSGRGLEIQAEAEAEAEAEALKPKPKPFCSESGKTTPLQARKPADLAKWIINGDGIGRFDVDASIRNGWLEMHPGIEVGTELLKAAAWVMANPTKRKQNQLRFLNNWMSRAQERV